MDQSALVHSVPPLKSLHRNARGRRLASRAPPPRQALVSSRGRFLYEWRDGSVSFCSSAATYSPSNAGRTGRPVTRGGFCSRLQMVSSSDLSLRPCACFFLRPEAPHLIGFDKTARADSLLDSLSRFACKKPDQLGPDARTDRVSELIGFPS